LNIFGRPGAHEEVWSLGEQSILPDSPHMGDQEHYRSHEYLPEEEQPPGMIQKSDTINSTTIFINPNDVHSPQQQEDVPGGSGQQHQQELEQGGQQGVKRRYSECEGEGSGGVKVVVVRAGQQEEQQHMYQPDQQLIFPEDMEEIPLGGSAEQHHASLAKQDTLRIPFEAVMNEGQQPKMELGDSRDSWTTSSVMVPVASAAQPSPTGKDPSTADYPGPYQFDIRFSHLSRQGKNKHWDYSTTLRKLYIDMNKLVQAEFRVGPSPPDGLWIRALPIYAEAGHIREPVRRCPNHASVSDPTNQPPEHGNPTHLIRMDGSDTLYCDDKESGRLSVIFPVRAPHQGSEFTHKLMKFMCLGSDVGGINRRPLKVIFTLEAVDPAGNPGIGHVLGRKVVEVRICSCPKRDRQQEEQRAQAQEDQARTIGQRFATTTVVLQPPSVPPPGKKRLEKDKVIMVPVHVDDFKKLNEFAEAAWVCRDLENSTAIKEKRRQLLEAHNRDLIRSLDKKKPS